MTTADERVHILKMIGEGKISPSEGIRLLELGVSEPQSQPAEKTAKAPSWLHVQVTDISTGKVRVNVRLPVNLINAGLKMGAKLSTEIENMDMSQIAEYIRSGYTGPVLDVLVEDEEEHVQIFLE